MSTPWMGTTFTASNLTELRGHKNFTDDTVITQKGDQYVGTTKGYLTFLNPFSYCFSSAPDRDESRTTFEKARSEIATGFQMCTDQASIISIEFGNAKIIFTGKDLKSLELDVIDKRTKANIDAGMLSQSARTGHGKDSYVNQLSSGDFKMDAGEPFIGRPSELEQHQKAKPSSGKRVVENLDAARKEKTAPQAGGNSDVSPEVDDRSSFLTVSDNGSIEAAPPEKKRFFSSWFSGGSSKVASADLEKVLYGELESKQKATLSELLNKETGKKAEERRGVSQRRNPTERAQIGAESLKGAMAETGQLLEERGEKLENIADKSYKLSAVAAATAKDSQLLKEQLRAENEKYSLKGIGKAFKNGLASLIGSNTEDVKNK